MKRVAFVGPSAHGLSQKFFDDIERRGPAKRGDLLAAFEAGFNAIVLIDGAFGEAPTVSHKEILQLLSHGVILGGAASLGAIRAAECEPFGMSGIGEIYQEYASGNRQGDADVMLCHAPSDLGYIPTSLALVDCEATLRKIPKRHVTLAEASALLVRARKLHFSERNWDAIAETLPLHRRAHAIRAMKQHQVYRKRADAMLGLDWLRNV